MTGLLLSTTTVLLFVFAVIAIDACQRRKQCKGGKQDDDPKEATTINMEILHKDTLAVVTRQATYCPDHGPLMDVLRSRYPSWRFYLVAEHGESFSVGKKRLYADGKIIADNFKAWLTAEVEAAGKNPQAVWEKYKDAGLALGEWRGHILYIAVPYSSEPDAFFQIEIAAKHEVTTRYAFEDGTWSVPDSLDALLQPVTDLAPEYEISPWRYELRQIFDVRRFVRDMMTDDKSNHETSPIRDFIAQMYPAWPPWKHPIARFFQDWQESSAGQSGHRFCLHWYLQVYDYTAPNGKRHISATPQWANKGGGKDLSGIQPNEGADPLTIFSMLSDFDRQAGYPFAWYFYMLHGNRISSSTGCALVQGLEAKSIFLPSHDEKVLLHWYGRPYGF